MKRNLLCLAIGLTCSAGAMAGAISLPGNSPLKVKYQNYEQIAPQGYKAADGNTYSNWGIAQLTEIDVAKVVGSFPNPPSFTNVTAIYNYVSEADANGGYYAIFSGLQPATAATAGHLDSLGGTMKIYYLTKLQVQTLDFINSTPQLSGWTGTYVGLTDVGQLLATLDFTPGILAGNSSVSTDGTAIPASDTFSGEASSFLNVDTGAGGAWANALNGNYFGMDLLPAGAPDGVADTYSDVYIKSSYSGLTSWDNASLGLFGAYSDDPVLAYTVPEPATLGLLGLGLLGMGVATRRRKV